MPDAKLQRYRIWICDGPSCGLAFASERLVVVLQDAIQRDEALKDRVGVGSYTCYGRCAEGPNMFVHAIAEGDEPDDEPDLDVLETQRGFYPGMDEAKVLRVLEEHCKAGTPVEDLVDIY